MGGEGISIRIIKQTCLILILTSLQCIPGSLGEGREDPQNSAGGQITSEIRNFSSLVTDDNDMWKAKAKELSQKFFKTIFPPVIESRDEVYGEVTIEGLDWSTYRDMKSKQFMEKQHEPPWYNTSAIDAPKYEDETTTNCTQQQISPTPEDVIKKRRLIDEDYNRFKQRNIPELLRKDQRNEVDVIRGRTKYIRKIQSMAVGINLQAKQVLIATNMYTIERVEDLIVPDSYKKLWEYAANPFLQAESVQKILPLLAEERKFQGYTVHFLGAKIKDNVFSLNDEMIRYVTADTQVKSRFLHGNEIIWCENCSAVLTNKEKFKARKALTCEDYNPTTEFAFQLKATFGDSRSPLNWTLLHRKPEAMTKYLKQERQSGEYKRYYTSVSDTDAERAKRKRYLSDGTNQNNSKDFDSLPAVLLLLNANTNCTSKNDAPNGCIDAQAVFNALEKEYVNITDTVLSTVDEVGIDKLQGSDWYVKRIKQDIRGCKCKIAEHLSSLVKKRNVIEDLMFYSESATALLKKTSISPRFIVQSIEDREAIRNVPVDNANSSIANNNNTGNGNLKSNSSSTSDYKIQENTAYTKSIQNTEQSKGLQKSQVKSVNMATIGTSFIDGIQQGDAVSILQMTELLVGGKALGRIGTKMLETEEHLASVAIQVLWRTIKRAEPALGNTAIGFSIYKLVLDINNIDNTNVECKRSVMEINEHNCINTDTAIANIIHESVQIKPGAISTTLDIFSAYSAATDPLGLLDDSNATAVSARTNLSKNDIDDILILNNDKMEITFQNLTHFENLNDGVAHKFEVSDVTNVSFIFKNASIIVTKNIKTELTSTSSPGSAGVTEDESFTTSNPESTNSAEVTESTENESTTTVNSESTDFTIVTESEMTASFYNETRLIRGTCVLTDRANTTKTLANNIRQDVNNVMSGRAHIYPDAIHATFIFKNTDEEDKFRHKFIVTPDPDPNPKKFTVITESEVIVNFYNLNRSMYGTCVFTDKMASTKGLMDDLNNIFAESLYVANFLEFPSVNIIDSTFIHKNESLIVENGYEFIDIFKPYTKRRQLSEGVHIIGSNVFIKNGSNPIHVTGETKNNLFLISEIREGYLYGSGGKDTLYMVGNLSSTQPPTVIDFSQRNIQRPGHSSKLRFTSFEHIMGSAGVGEKVIAGCDLQLVELEGGSAILYDEINITNTFSGYDCVVRRNQRKEIVIMVKPFTRVNNMAGSGKFIYQLELDAQSSSTDFQSVFQYNVNRSLESQAIHEFKLKHKISETEIVKGDQPGSMTLTFENGQNWTAEFNTRRSYFLTSDNMRIMLHPEVYGIIKLTPNQTHNGNVIVGMKHNSNVFILEDKTAKDPNEVRTYQGGSKNDLFVITSETFTGKIFGNDGENALVLDKFRPDEDLLVNFNSGKVYTNLTQPIPGLTFKDIQIFMGRENQSETVIVNCSLHHVDTKGSLTLKPDFVGVLRQEDCYFNLKISLRPNLFVENLAFQGSFTYEGNISKENTTLILPFNQRLMHKILLNFEFNAVEALQTLDNTLYVKRDGAWLITNYLINDDSDFHSQPQIVFADGIQLKIGRYGETSFSAYGNLYTNGNTVEMSTNSKMSDLDWSEYLGIKVEKCKEAAKKLNTTVVLQTNASTMVSIGAGGLFDVVTAVPKFDNILIGNMANQTVYRISSDVAKVTIHHGIRSETSPSKTSSSKVSTSTISPSKTSPSKTSLRKTSPSNISPSTISPSKTSSRKTFPSRTSPSKTSPTKISPRPTSPSKTSPSKTFPNETLASDFDYDDSQYDNDSDDNDTMSDDGVSRKVLLDLTPIVKNRSDIFVHNLKITTDSSIVFTIENTSVQIYNALKNGSLNSPWQVLLRDKFLDLTCTNATCSLNQQNILIVPKKTQIIILSPADLQEGNKIVLQSELKLKLELCRFEDHLVLTNIFQNVKDGGDEIVSLTIWDYYYYYTNQTAENFQRKKFEIVSNEEVLFVLDSKLGENAKLCLDCTQFFGGGVSLWIFIGGIIVSVILFHLFVFMVYKTCANDFRNLYHWITKPRPNFWQDIFAPTRRMIQEIRAVNCDTTSCRKKFNRLKNANKAPDRTERFKKLSLHVSSNNTMKLPKDSQDICRTKLVPFNLNSQKDTDGVEQSGESLLPVSKNYDNQCRKVKVRFFNIPIFKIKTRKDEVKYDSS